MKRILLRPPAFAISSSFADAYEAGRFLQLDLGEGSRGYPYGARWDFASLTFCDAVGYHRCSNYRLEEDGWRPC